MSRHTENKEEILKIHSTIDLINQRLDTLEHNHLAHMQKDIDRILKIPKEDTQKKGSTSVEKSIINRIGQ